MDKLELILGDTEGEGALRMGLVGIENSPSTESKVVWVMVETKGDSRTVWVPVEALLEAVAWMSL